MHSSQHLVLTDFLSATDHATVLDWAIAREQDYVPSLVGSREKSPHRQSSSLADFGPCLDIIRSAVKPIVHELGSHFGISFGPKPKFDASFTAHNDGAFYKPHTDLGNVPEHRTRALSMVYYFFNQPARFSGGALRVFRIDRPGEYVDVPPQDNSLAVFPAMVPHEVRPVHCPSLAHADSRFAINIWAHTIEDQDKT